MRFHVFSDDLDEADKQLLTGIAARRKNTEVAFYEPARVLTREMLDHIAASLQFNSTYVTKETYYRLLAADLLSQDVHRALYLDGDVICTGSIDRLFRTDLKGCPVGLCLSHDTSSIFVYNQLEYPPSERYFYGAPILFDIDLWRKENLTKSMFDYLKDNVKKLWWHDKDLINAVLHGRIFQLDFSSSVMPVYYNVFYWIQEDKNKYYARETQFLPKSEWPALLAGVENPIFADFVGVPKPWYRECDKPFAPVWRYFYAQSPWADEPLPYFNPPPQLTVKKRIKRLGRKLFEALHLVEKRKPSSPHSPPCPYPQEAYAIAQGVLDRLLEEDKARV